MRCLICNEEMKNEMDFRNLFVRIKTIHDSCTYMLYLKHVYETIPLSNQLIHHLYFLSEYSSVKSWYLEQVKISELLQYYLSQESRSIIIWSGLDIILSLPKDTLSLVLGLFGKEWWLIEMQNSF